MQDRTTEQPADAQPIEGETTQQPEGADADTGSAGDASGAMDEAPGGDQASDVGSEVASQLDVVGNSFEQFAEEPSIENAIGVFGPLLVDLGLAIAGLIVLFVVVSIIGRWTQRFTRMGLTRLHMEETVVQFLARASRYAIWIIAIPIALELFGVKTTSIAAVIGATGLAIGLAMQGSLSNIAAGIMLLALRPFKIGDWVEINDEEGVVHDVGIFYTTITTWSNNHVILPNSEVLGAKVEHYTATDTRRVEVPIGVAYGTDLDRARKTLEEAAGEVSRADEHEPDVILTAFGGSSIDFEVRVWGPSKDYLKLRTEAINAINRALEKAEIEIPFPHRTLTFPERLGLDLGEEAAKALPGSGSDD